MKKILRDKKVKVQEMIFDLRFKFPGQFLACAEILAGTIHELNRNNFECSFVCPCCIRTVLLEKTVADLDKLFQLQPIPMPEVVSSIADYRETLLFIQSIDNINTLIEELIEGDNEE